MPARSQAQQRAAGAALSAKRGETNPDDLHPASRSMYDSMTEGELEEIATTKLDGLPEHVEDVTTPLRGD
jgi:2-methylcitrate dehydratase PrpD